MAPLLKICRTRVARIIVSIALLGGVVLFGRYSYRFYVLNKVISASEESLNRGFTRLAIDRLERYRYQLVETESGCRILSKAYSQVLDVEKMEWTAQACIESGRDTPEVYLLLAKSAEMQGKRELALQYASEALSKYSKNTEIIWYLGGLSDEMGKVDESDRWYQLAAVLEPENREVVTKSLSYFAAKSKWLQVGMIANLLRAKTPNDPDVLLLNAKVALKRGQAEVSQSFVEQALRNFPKEPEKVQQLVGAYPELLSRRFPELRSIKHTP